jgi:phosphoglycolate phosphatase
LTLFLFDIDGTLIRTGGVGRASMVEASRRLFGRIDLFDRFDFAGAVDPVIVSTALHHIGIHPDARRLGRFRATYVRALQRNIPLARGGVCGGVHEALGAIPVEEPVGLITGNWPEGARIKLEHFSLWSRFSPTISGFGGDAPDRSGLFGVALRGAARRSLQPKRVVVIGDTESDIRSARRGHARLGPSAPELITIGVRTGFGSPEALEASAPDLLVDQLTARLIRSLR